MNEPRYSEEEFERESRYIENLVWDALVVERDTRVLFCGYGEDARYVVRAIDAGARVSVIEHREEAIARFSSLHAELIRGSTSVIPAPSGSFDLAIAFHYLHETDPFFHAQIVSELSRVALRVAIVEPGPPADRIGKKIARLYSQAKRELGQFEYYQPLEYWRKLLQPMKADVAQHVFAFAKVPPLEYVRDTIDLLLDTMKAEDAPEADLAELRELARRSDAMLLPPPRFVVVGAAAGELPQPVFTPREEPTPTPAIATAVRTAATALQPTPPAQAPKQRPSAPAPSAVPPPNRVPPPAPFAIPGIPEMPSPPAFGVPWQWEPPEESDER